MKEIYVCTDFSTNRQVAFAQISPQKHDLSEAFLREARITAMLQHPNIVPVYDIGILDELAYFTMKLIEGYSLNEIIKKNIYSSHELLNVFIKVCEAVSYAHSKGIIHLDLKPDNIQVSEHGEVQVCDWGLAKIVNYEQDDLPVQPESG